MAIPSTPTMKTNGKQRVALITGHYLGSKRRAGFHWLADAYHRRGDEVLFFTAPISWLSWLKRDFKFKYPVVGERNQMIQKEPGLWSFVWLTPFHPANFRYAALNAAVTPLLRLYPKLPLGKSRDFLRSADLIVFESTAAITLFPVIRSLNPDARIVYRVSDDLAFMKNHAVAIQAESRWANDFDLISVPIRGFMDKFPGANCRHQLHGIRKDLFDITTDNPYGSGGMNAVFVGLNYLDKQFLQTASELRPDWNFHIIGLDEQFQATNVHWHGVRPFEETIAYIKFADIGLLNLIDIPGASCFTDSLKTIQYSYCRLPIIAPKMLVSNRKNFFHYEPGNRESIEETLTRAAEADRHSFSHDGIWSWDELAGELAGDSEEISVSRPMRRVSA